MNKDKKFLSMSLSFNFYFRYFVNLIYYLFLFCFCNGKKKTSRDLKYIQFILPNNQI